MHIARQAVPCAEIFAGKGMAAFVHHLGQDDDRVNPGKIRRVQALTRLGDKNIPAQEQNPSGKAKKHQPEEKSCRPEGKASDSLKTGEKGVWRPEGDAQE